MKKAKQILSLMLVIAMALGMMVFVPGTASAKNLADYPDADDIEYKEAVDVLSALGVLLGDDTGAFGPKSNITREQAAKIITYILIGTTAADRLAPRESSFTDVDTSRWSNPYIEYCVEKGIIKGYGDGRFGPADSVTAAQMAKMLLMCIGYGSLGEYDNPDSWQLNTIVDGQKRGILTLDNDYTQPATREEVALYTFNAMADDEAYLVTYSELLKQYMPRGSTFTAVSETYLINETFKLYDKDYEDSLGYSVRDWRFNSANNVNAATGAYRTDVTIGKSAAGSQLTMLFGGSYYGLLDKTSFGYISDLLGFETRSGVFFPVEVWLNGAQLGYASEYGQTASVIRENVAAYEFVNHITGATTTVNSLAGTRGVVVDLVDRNDDGVADKLVFIQKTVGIITSKPAVDAFGTTTLNGVRNSAGGFTFPRGTVSYPEDLVADDVVLYYRDAKGFTTVELAKTVSGTMTAYTPSSMGPAFASITFGGTAYYATGLTPAVVPGEPYETMLSFATEPGNIYFNQPATLILDDGNAVIAVNPDGEGELDYLVVLDFVDVVLSGIAQAQVVLSDGSVRNITVSNIKQGITTYPTATTTVYQQLLANDPGKNGQIYTYSIDADGNYVLKYAANNAIAGNTAVARRANFNSGYVGNASTVFIVRSVSASGGYVFNVFTGVGNAPVFDDPAVIIGSTRVQSGGSVVYDSTGSVAKFVYLKGNPKDTEKNTLLFYNSGVFTERYVDGKPVYDYNVIDVDGVAGATKVVTLNDVAHGMVSEYYGSSGYSSELYEVTYNATGVVTSATSCRVSGDIGGYASDLLWKVGVYSVPSGSNITFGTLMTGLQTARYTSDTKVYQIDLENLFNPVTVISIADVLKSTTNLVIGKFTIVDGKATDILSELYIVKRASATEISATLTGTLSLTAAVGDVIGTTLAGISVSASYDNGDIIGGAAGALSNFLLFDTATYGWPSLNATFDAAGTYTFAVYKDPYTFGDSPIGGINTDFSPKVVITVDVS